MKLKQFVPTAAQRKLVADLLDQVDLPRPAAKAEAEAETEANSLKDTATQE
jgi:hypothetical protein